MLGSTTVSSRRNLISGSLLLVGLLGAAAPARGGSPLDLARHLTHLAGHRRRAEPALGAPSAVAGGHWAEPARLSPAQAELLRHLPLVAPDEDVCGAISSSRARGYQLLEYTVKTSDNYLLTLHRLVHPEHLVSGHLRTLGGPARKPYVLLHGLLGSSASFLRGSRDEHYLAPAERLDADQLVEETLAEKRGQAYKFLHEWRSTADLFNEAYLGDKSNRIEGLTLKERLLKQARQKEFARSSEINMDHDSLVFGRHFRKVHREFQLPERAKAHVSRSLAATLANLGYDVWLVNLRGNAYSSGHAGSHSASADDSQYWNFNADTLVRQDLLAALNFVQTEAQWRKPLGLVAYSYSNSHVLNLLTNQPEYQERLQPVVMLAPTLFTGIGRDTGFKVLLRSTDLLLARNGAFPNRLGGSSLDKLLKLLCRLPVAGKLCHLLQLTLYGRSRSLRQLADDSVTALAKRDSDCGQTSLAVFHEIVKNLSEEKILPKYQPFVGARNRLDRGQRVRRSVILVHSQADQISTPEEVRKIRESALKLLVLADYTVQEPDFGHADFLFSKKNQFLVNAEVARMVSAFDFLLARPVASQASEHSPGVLH